MKCSRLRTSTNACLLVELKSGFEETADVGVVKLLFEPDGEVCKDFPESLGPPAIGSLQ